MKKFLMWTLIRPLNVFFQDTGRSPTLLFVNLKTYFLELFQALFMCFSIDLTLAAPCNGLF